MEETSEKTIIVIQRDHTINTMAVETTTSSSELKRLGFVPTAATSAIATAEPYYESLKSKSGPLKEHVEMVEKAVIEYGTPYYTKYMPYLLETVDGQVDSAILFGQSLYDAGKSQISVSALQSALVAASDNLRAAKDKVTSALHTESMTTFLEAREAYKMKLMTYLSTMKESGEKLPEKIKEMIATNVEYLKESVISFKDSPSVGPYIDKATEYYSKSVQPYVESAMSKAQPYVDTAISKVQPYVEPYLPKAIKSA